MHAGHVHHIQKTKAALGEDNAVICVMSGNFVQRGEGAIINKFARAKAAVKAGADLVIENPVLWSMASAQRFSQGAVSIADDIGVCTHLSFGSEAGNVDTLAEIAACLSDDRMDDLINKAIKKGASYHAARQSAAEEILGRQCPEMAEPNNILAIEYLKALKERNSPLIPMTVPRVGAGHDSEERGETVSASYIREIMRSGGSIDELVPRQTAEIIEHEISCGRAPADMVVLNTAIIARLRTIDMDGFLKLPDSTEELYFRIKKAVAESSDFSEVCGAVRTKRYPKARVRRVIMCALLGIEKDDYIEKPPYAKVLAIGKNGRKLLSEMNEKSKIPVITKPSSVRDMDDMCQRVFEIEARASDIYCLMYENGKYRKGGADYKTTPYVII